jgi:hypothetical protein
LVLPRGGGFFSSCIEGVGEGFGFGVKKEERMKTIFLDFKKLVCKYSKFYNFELHLKNKPL